MKEMIQPPDSGNNKPSVASAAPQQQTQVATGGFDLIKLKQYVHIIARRIWIVAICFAIAMVFSVISVSKQVSTYRSSTILLLSRGSHLPGIGRLQDERNIFGDFIDTQVRIIYSKSVLRRARESLNMSDGEISMLSPSVRVYPIGRSSTVYVDVKSLDPHFSANYANAIANSYIEFKADERVLGAQTSAINLTQQANRIREELKKSEEALILFKKENLFVTAMNTENIAAEIMMNAAQRAANHKLERMVLELQRPMLSDAPDEVVLAALGSQYMPMTPTGKKSGPGIEQTFSEEAPHTAISSISPIGVVSQSEGYSDQQWISLKKQKTTLEYELRAARENLRESHPRIKQMVKEIKSLEEGLNREVQFATERYFADLEALSIKEKTLVQVQSMWQEEAIGSEVLLDQYQSYQNDITRLKRMLDAVYSRIREIDISTGIIPDNVAVLDKAVASGSPEKPRKLSSIFIAGLIGIGVGIGIVFGLEFLDDSIRYPEDIEKSLRINFLGVIPSANWSDSDLRTHLLSNIDPKSGLAESYRNIRASILTSDNTKKFKTLLMTSSVPKEGKTTTSLNLAISFAQAGMRVLLVDADMRRGELHKYFGLEGGRGLSDVLNGQTKMESVIQRTGIPNLDMVATGPFPVNPAELVLRNEFRFFVEHASRSYDKIIFDGPPVMAVSEAAVLASLVDASILVVWAGKTSRKLCQLTLQNLVQRGANVEGCILNNLEFGRVGYYYYSTYYSYYTYDYRYDETHRGA